jgi:predicted dehydrogenase
MRALAKGTHLKHCQMDEDITLQVVCDTDWENLKYCKEKFGAVRAESDWRKVIEADDVDLCILSTHQTFRGEFIIPALKAGKPVYTEKPLAPDIDEMLEILKVTGETGVPVCVGHNRRRSPAMLEFKRLARKPKLNATEHWGQTVTNYVGYRKRIPEENAM